MSSASGGGLYMNERTNGFYKHTHTHEHTRRQTSVKRIRMAAAIFVQAFLI